MKPEQLHPADGRILVIMNFSANAACAPRFRSMAKSMAVEPGLVWKIRT